MSNLNETSTEDNNRLIVLGTVMEQMSSVCTGANESEGLLRDGGDVVIGGDESEIVICGDAVDGVPSPGTTSEEPLEQLERRGVMKEGKADKETIGGGDSGNNVVKKGGDGGDGDIGGGEDVVCSARGCSNKGVQAIASGKSKRIKEGLRVLNRHKKGKILPEMSCHQKGCEESK